MNQETTPAINTVDTQFTWYCETAQTDVVCHLKIYQVTFDKAVVIVSNLMDKDSLSVIQSTSSLIYMVSYKFGLSLNKTMWFEQNQTDNLLQEDTYSEVMLELGQVSHRGILSQKLEVLLGVKLSS